MTAPQSSIGKRKRSIWAIDIFALSLVVLAGTVDARAEVRAFLDRDSVYVGDTVNLSIQADGQIQGVQPDLSPLEKDFEVLGTRTNTQIRIINGRRSDTTAWSVELEPSATGVLEIPRLRVGNERTGPLRLRVAAEPASGPRRKGADLYVEVEVVPKDDSPLVQQQILYTVRLYSRVPVLDGGLTDPAPENALVERLGANRSYEATRHGQRYQIVERSYAIFPERSGELKIPPVEFTGRVATATGSRPPRSRIDRMMERFFGDDPFKDPLFDRDFFGGSPFAERGRRVHTKSQGLSLDIKPRPETYSGAHWLPSERVVLRDSWGESPPELRAGEPVTRTLSIEAKGLESSHLPALPVPDLPDLRIYREQPVQENRTDGTWIYGTSEQQLTYIPAHSGPVALPEIRLTWWDTAAGQERVATLPGWQLNVLPGIASPGSSRAQPQSARAEALPEPEPTLVDRQEPAGDSVWDSKLSLRVIGTLALGALIVTLLALVGRRMLRRGVGGSRATRGRARLDPGAVVAIANARAARRALQQACADNDPRKAGQALLQWAGTRWPQDAPTNLGAVAGRLAAAANPIRELDRVLYAQEGTGWNGRELWEALAEALANEPRSSQPDPMGLGPLYPQRG
jgi:hypothetical protein